MRSQHGGDEADVEEDHRRQQDAPVPRRQQRLRLLRRLRRRRHLQGPHGLRLRPPQQGQVLRPPRPPRGRRGGRGGLLRGHPHDGDGLLLGRLEQPEQQGRGPRRRRGAAPGDPEVVRRPPEDHGCLPATARGGQPDFKGRRHEGARLLQGWLQSYQLL